VLLMGPYLWLLFIICRPYADCGSFLFYVSDMFLVSMFEVSVCLPDI
jgi:hypothetical protein